MTVKRVQGGKRHFLMRGDVIEIQNACCDSMNESGKREVGGDTGLKLKSETIKISFNIY